MSDDTIDQYVKIRREENKMKKWTAILCGLLMICLAAAAFAEAPVSNLYRPETSDMFRALVGGKSFEAKITGWGSYGEEIGRAHV